jgi:hypothetical protein
MTNAPLGAPELQPDTERKPLIKTTRLPYLSIVAIAIVVLAIIGAVTMRERVTQPSEVVGIQVTPPPPASPTAAPAS